ncbi:MAG: redoxin domain-containing protein [Rhodospirillales bacterium]|nr:redoxin domain-containing protein [Rhodospirillales bacterium]
MSALKELGVSVIAASTDPEDKAAEIAADLSYPVAYGVTQEQADILGAWWEPNRPIIQPTEFLLDADHKIITATYSAGPIGRMNAPDLVKVVQFNEKKRLEG